MHLTQKKVAGIQMGAKSFWLSLGLNCEAKQQSEPLMEYGYNRCQEKSHNWTDTKITMVGNR